MKTAFLFISLGLLCLGIHRVNEADDLIASQNTYITNLEQRLDAYRYDMQRAQPYIKVDTMFTDGKPRTIIVKVTRPPLLDPSILMLSATPEAEGAWSIAQVNAVEEEVK
jgi:hypothetical protein